MDDEFAESGDLTPNFGVSEARSDFDKCERLKKFYMDAFISHISNDQRIQAQTPFELMDFISFTVHLSEGASPFHKIEWKSKRGKELHADLESLFNTTKFAGLHASRIPVTEVRFAEHAELIKTYLRMYFDHVTGAGETRSVYADDSMRQ